MSQRTRLKLVSTLTMLIYIQRLNISLDLTGINHIYLKLIAMGQEVGRDTVSMVGEYFFMDPLI